MPVRYGDLVAREPRDIIQRWSIRRVQQLASNVDEGLAVAAGMLRIVPAFLHKLPFAVSGSVWAVVAELRRILLLLVFYYTAGLRPQGSRQFTTCCMLYPA